MNHVSVTFPALEFIFARHDQALLWQLLSKWHVVDSVPELSSLLLNGSHRLLGNAAGGESVAGGESAAGENAQSNTAPTVTLSLSCKEQMLIGPGLLLLSAASNAKGEVETFLRREFSAGEDALLDGVNISVQVKTLSMEDLLNPERSGLGLSKMEKRKRQRQKKL